MKKQSNYRKHQCASCNLDTKVMERPIWSDMNKEWFCDLKCRDMFEKERKMLNK